MKLGQNVCLDEMGHVGSKTRSLGQILKKPGVHSWGYIFSPILINLVRLFTLMKSWMSLKIGHVLSKSRLPGQVLEKPSVPSRGHIFNLILMKLGQNVCLNEISDEFENGSCGVKN